MAANVSRSPVLGKARRAKGALVDDYGDGGVVESSVSSTNAMAFTLGTLGTLTSWGSTATGSQLVSFAEDGNPAAFSAVSALQTALPFAALLASRRSATDCSRQLHGQLRY
jgi:hypothetical protein